MINSAERYFNIEEFIDECVDLLGDKIKSCHIKDVHLKEEYTFQLEECAPGLGEFPLRYYAKKLHDLDNDMPIILEHLNTDEEYLKYMEYFGEKFAMPVLTPAFSHIGNYHDRELTGLEEYSVAAKNQNVLNFCGMMENDLFKKIMDTGAKTIRIVKPYADHAKVLDQMQYAEDIGAFGIGMDIDHMML